MTDSTRVTITNMRTTAGAAQEGKALVADGDGNVVLSGITTPPTNLGDLDDVTVAGASQGELLTYNSSIWIASGLPAEPIRYIELEPFSFVGQIPCSTGDGKAYFHVTAGLDGLSLVECHAEVKLAGTTGTMSIMVANETQSVDMLTTALSVDSGETGSDTAASSYAIKSNGDEVISENDMVRLDFDAVHSTPASGCIVSLGFS